MKPNDMPPREAALAIERDLRAAAPHHRETRRERQGRAVRALVVVLVAFLLTILVARLLARTGSPERTVPERAP